MVSAPFIVVIDANVLFPLTLRDTVLRAAAAGLFQLRWSAQILDEVERNLVSKGAMTADKAARLRAAMERYFPEAEVTGYDHLVAAMENDPKDRHVVAAAVKAGAQVVTTSNLADFAPLPEGIEAQSPDEFLANLFDLDPDGFIELLQEQAADLVRPPVTFSELLERLDRVVPGLVAAVRERLKRRAETGIPRARFSLIFRAAAMKGVDRALAGRGVGGNPEGRPGPLRGFLRSARPISWSGKPDSNRRPSAWESERERSHEVRCLPRVSRRQQCRQVGGRRAGWVPPAIARIARILHRP